MCRWPWPGGVGGVCWWHAAWWPEPGGLGLVAGAVVAGAVVAGAVVAGACGLVAGGTEPIVAGGRWSAGWVRWGWAVDVGRRGGEARQGGISEEA